MNGMERVQARMGIWLMLLVVALLCGLPLNQTTIFWVGVSSLWVLAGWTK